LAYDGHWLGFKIWALDERWFEMKKNIDSAGAYRVIRTSELTSEQLTVLRHGGSMKIVVVDLTADLDLATRSMELALATARLTETRAKLLLDVARAAPEQLEKARGIYIRAATRVKRLQAALDRMVPAGGEQ
jgi:hypothetical protein